MHISGGCERNNPNCLRKSTDSSSPIPYSEFDLRIFQNTAKDPGPSFGISREIYGLEVFLVALSCFNVAYTALFPSSGVDKFGARWPGIFVKFFQKLWSPFLKKLKRVSLNAKTRVDATCATGRLIAPTTSGPPPSISLFPSPRQAHVSQE